MNPEPFTDDVRHEELLWTDQSYKRGWERGLLMVTDVTTERTSHLTNKIEELEGINETLEQRIAGRDETIAYLKQPWYRKLLNKLPNIKIEWKRYHNE